jgi:hypothetical protein
MRLNVTLEYNDPIQSNWQILKGGGTRSPALHIRKAANLTQLLTKAPKFRNGNKNFDYVFNWPFWGPSKKTF